MNIPTLEQMQEALSLKTEIARLETQLRQTLGIARVGKVMTARGTKTARVDYLSTLGPAFATRPRE